MFLRRAVPLDPAGVVSRDGAENEGVETTLADPTQTLPRTAALPSLTPDVTTGGATETSCWG